MVLAEKSFQELATVAGVSAPAPSVPFCNAPYPVKIGSPVSAIVKFIREETEKYSLWWYVAVLWIRIRSYRDNFHEIWKPERSGEAWRVCNTVIVKSQHFNEEQNPDPLLS